MSSAFSGSSSHAGRRAHLIGLSRSELNGVRVKLEKYLQDRERWRVCRADNNESLGVKLENLAPEQADRLPPAIGAAANANGDGSLVRTWLDSGGEINATLRPTPSDLGRTLLMLACDGGKAELAAELVRRGADVNARDDEGGTALMLALHHPDIVRLLLDAGARTELRWTGRESFPLPPPGSESTRGQTALETAQKEGLDAAAQLIRAHEAAAAEATSTADASAAPLRDVHLLEMETLMRVLSADMLAQQTGLLENGFMDVERERWLKRMISKAFADPHDVASLSRRFLAHGVERALDPKLWAKIARREADMLARRARFKEIAIEVSSAMPGLMEQLGGWAYNESGLKVMEKEKNDDD